VSFTTRREPASAASPALAQPAVSDEANSADHAGAGAANAAQPARSPPIRGRETGLRYWGTQWGALVNSWTHQIARVLVTPLIGTPVRPNHLTTMRLVTGIGACAAVAVGTSTASAWGGMLWLVSAFLDRADGELARVGGMTSEAGHRYDFLADVVVNLLLFVCAGFGARHGWLGGWGFPLGIVATVSMLVCWVVGDAFERLQGGGAKVYPGRWGFDVDDGLYLVAPLIWLGLMSFVVVGAAVATTVLAAWVLVRFRRLRSGALGTKT
jgi:archaetidylinositol phosphate synthase